MPTKKFNFISGLPRSGSTYLSALLLQNPKFNAGISSGLYGLYSNSLQFMCTSEASPLISEEQKLDVLRGIFQSYYRNTKAEVVFDTSRGWTSKIHQVAGLFPTSKVICCVRDLSWILDNLERLIRHNKFLMSGLNNFDPHGTVYSRVLQWASSEGIVGGALDNLKTAFFDPISSDRMIIVRHNSLINDTEATLKQVYEFIGEHYFQHSFDTVSYSEDKFDEKIGTPGLHTIPSPLGWVDEGTILPPDLFNRFTNDSFWDRKEINVCNIPVI